MMPWSAKTQAAICAAAMLTLTLRAPARQAAPAGHGVPTITTPAVRKILTEPPADLTPAQVAAMQKTLADWAQLSRYADDDATLGPPQHGKSRVVFYGDSLTDNWGRLAGTFFPAEPWINRGISGQTTPQLLVRFRQDVLDLHPQAVVVLAGTNDIAGNTGAETLPQIEGNFRSMVTLAKAAHIRVLLSSVLPASQIPWNKGVDPREEIVALNHWLRQFAAEQGLVYIDYYTAMVAPDGGMQPQLAIDGFVHPNTAGYAVMEPLAHAAVEQALARPAP